ncbi:MAG: MFS transporter [Oscillospiraceae bacterium]|nr:MFS transporter [Oscillospiraceae bacterium]
MAQPAAESQASEHREAPKSRRYVDTKESVGFVLYDVAASWNIAKHDSLYLTDVLRIDFDFTAAFKPILAVWDVINDIFLASFIEKTRTRFGKFRPYLIAYALIAVPIIVFYYTMGSIWGARPTTDITKLAVFVVINVIRNLADSAGAIARTGIIATITPDIRDRTRLITQAQLLSGFVEKAPEILLGMLIDLSNNDVIGTPLPTIFAWGGVLTVIGGGLMSFYFAIKSRERVPQSLEPPKIKESFRSLSGNRPLILMMLAEFLGAFSLNPGTSLYFTNVLKFNTMSTVTGIPGAIVSPLSFAYVPKLRTKLSTRTLWIAGTHAGDILLLFVFFVGRIGSNFKRLAVMIPAFMLQETLFMTVWGVRKVIPEELRNEAIDYGEWKNGFRAESMTGVAKGLPNKLVTSLGESVKALILKYIGYEQGAKAGTQTFETERKLFTMVTLLPVVTSAIGIIPKLMYNIDQKTRERMYAELAERRSRLSVSEAEQPKDA